MTPLETLAHWASTIAPADVPASQHRLIRLRILDTIGLIAAAAEHPAGRSLAAWANASGGDGASVLVTGSSASPAVAALVHGSLAHARDFDDTFAETVVHPGSTVIAATLAAAERNDTAFDTITTAIAVGYEIAGRLGAVAGRGFHARGFHATSIVGPVAAAAAAGRILGLDAPAMADALGLTTSMSSGLLAFLADGGWSKWLHTGWSAHGGLIAAEMASHAFRGPRHALDHRYGLYGAFLGAPDVKLDVLTDGLGETWIGATAQAKIFPCAHVIQPYIEAVLALHEAGRLRADDLQSLRCVMAPWALPIVGHPRTVKIAPRNDLEAIASLPFMVAAGLCDGRVDLNTLSAETIGRADILALAARIECDGDDTLGSGFDGSLHATLRDGRRISHSVTLAQPSEARIVAKFRANTTRLQPAACAALQNSLLNEHPSGRTLMILATASFSGRTNDARP